MNELKYHIDNIREILTYIFFYAPNFPKQDKTSLEENFQELIDHVVALMDKAENNSAKQWLQICLEEIRISLNLFQSGDVDSAKSTIESATDHFQDYLKGRKVKAKFSVSPNGTAQNE